MLKFEIIGDLFVLCAVGTLVAALVHRAAGERSLPGNQPALGPMDLLGGGSVFLVYYAFHALARESAGGEPEEITLAALVVGMVVQLMVMGVVLFFVAPRMNPVGFFGLRWPKWPWVFVIAPVGVAATWIVTAIFLGGGYFKWVEELLGEPPVQEAVKILRESNDPLLLGLMTFTVVIIAPLTEEVIFRGYLYPVLRHFTGRAFGVVMSALIFAVAHNEVGVLPVLVFLGILLAEVYERTRSIWAPIAVHALFNSATVAAQFVTRFLGEPLP